MSVSLPRFLLRMQADTQNGDFPVWFPIFMNEGGGGGGGGRVSF